MKKTLLLLPFLLLAGCDCADQCTGPTTRQELEPNDDLAHATALTGDDLYVEGVCSPSDPADVFVRASAPGDDPHDAITASLTWSDPGAVSVHLTGPSIDETSAAPVIDAAGTSHLAVEATVTTSGDAYLEIACDGSPVSYRGRFGPAGIW